jgi:hypothetical protein
MLLTFISGKLVSGVYLLFCIAWWFDYLCLDVQQLMMHKR